jgi:hypothetical protein
MLRLTQSVYWNGKSHLDFDTGRVFSRYEGLKTADRSPPAEFGTRVSGWQQHNGIDIECQGRIDSMDLRLWPVDARRWTRLETEVQKNAPLELGQEASRSLANFEQEQTGARDDELLTFLFTTREGGHGIVQIFPKDRDTDRFRLRYRMWLTAQAKPAARPTDDNVVAEPGAATAPGTSFGEVETRTVAQPGEGQDFLIDLNTGQMLPFLGPGVVEARILPETFNDLSPRGARELLDRVSHVQPHIAWIKVDAQLAERPDTFAFKNREGLVGLLQIEQSKEDAGKLTIRFRIERKD